MGLRDGLLPTRDCNEGLLVGRACEEISGEDGRGAVDVAGAAAPLGVVEVAIEVADVGIEVGDAAIEEDDVAATASLAEDTADGGAEASAALRVECAGCSSPLSVAMTAGAATVNTISCTALMRCS